MVRRVQTNDDPYNCTVFGPGCLTGEMILNLGRQQFGLVLQLY